MEQEIWKDILSYEGHYVVSNNGLVKSVRRIIKQKSGGSYPVKESIKTPRVGKNGYNTIALVANNKTKNTYLHRIIATAFIENKNNLKVINHKNGIKTDNRIENLEWCTSSHNNKHAIRTGLRRAPKSCIDKEQANSIMELRAKKFTYKEIAKLLNISRSSVSGLISGRSYAGLII